jgi:uncharacterized HhH-GPD family protein
MPTLMLAQDPAADALLAESPLALLIGMVLDQQVPLEWAFKGPLMLKERLGHLEIEKIAAMEPDALVAAFVQKPALHRFPAANARRVLELCRVVVEQYDGVPERVWTTATTGAELLAHLKGLPGFGDQKARIFVALLGKQLDVRPVGWEESAGPYGQAGTMMSVADITDLASLARVREYKKAKKAAAKEGG